MKSYSYKLAGQQNTFSLPSIANRPKQPEHLSIWLVQWPVKVFANQTLTFSPWFSLALSYVRLIKDKVNAKIQITNLKSSAFVLLIGIAKVQTKGKAEMKKMAAPINCVFLSIL